MKIIKIEYPTTLDNGVDIEDDNIDVFVTLDNNVTYTVVVSTYKNIETLMNRQENNNFLNPGCPFIIVKKLTYEIIEKAINSYADGDGYWLKMYGLAGEVSIQEIEANRK